MVPGAIIIMMVILIVIIYQKKLKEELIQVAIVIIFVIVANVTICQLEVLSFKQSSTDPGPQFCFQL